MKIIIVGGGSVGFQLAKHFTAEKKDVVLIEKDPEKARILANKLDCLVINEGAGNIQVLRNAGLEEADYFISVTDSDEVNLICCGLANNDKTFKIASVRNLNYESTRILSERLKYIDLIVNPEVEVSKRVIRAVEHGAISDIIFFEKSGLQMRNFLVGEDSTFLDRDIKAISQDLGKNFLVAGIARNDQFIIPTGDTMVRREDNLYLLAAPDTMDRIYETIGTEKIDIRKILIVGGGKIGRQVARHFIGKNPGKQAIFKDIARRLMGRDAGDATVAVKTIKIIDRDYNKCKRLAEEIPECLIINADISDEAIFKEENLNDFDLIVTATPSHELNVLAALYAKKVGIKRAVSVVSNVNYIHIAIRLGIDVVVSPKNSIIDPILNFIGSGAIKNIHSITDTETDIFEVTLKEGSQICGKQVRDLRLPPPSLVLTVNRNDCNIMPDGNTELCAGDHLLIMTKQQSVPRIEEMTNG
ncbi:MAG: Trk system potassium transporter TrkA [Candidatus Wallbacteria bacterium HGW-Wallbacteria-1]|uniref:Trk system potassium uptake protein TrkA n=1 Tax=Candidatus Wallbacteria bacterium HGW-Wallbacteria-1 TaxID=2013854 RepID=A0A2N1PKN6_9BACT|nr:MAG: Trk system potassium transporter TrkA [Candidatus Wallbacteria bacterium HGW-Wallbacteria-1]